MPKNGLKTLKTPWSEQPDLKFVLITIENEFNLL